jgi:uncharacterized protein YkwD
MKKLITLLLVLVSVSSYSQKKITSIEELREWNKLVDSTQTYFNGEDNLDSVLVLLNEYRVENGVNPLILTDNLIVTHKQNEELLESCYQRGWKYGEYGVTGEVIAERSIRSMLLRDETIYSSPIEGLKLSKGHSYIMKKSEYIRCGISMIQSDKDKNRYFTVIVFSEK